MRDIWHIGYSEDKGMQFIDLGAQQKRIRDQSKRGQVCS